MSFVYRYVDASEMECIYVGKVSGSEFESLLSRHKQHKHDCWYSQHGGNDNVFMEYVEFETAADADIYETALISFYCERCPEQLSNKGKMYWGKQSFVDIDSVRGWKLFNQHSESKSIEQKIKDAVSYIEFLTEKQRRLKRNLSVEDDCKFVSDAVSEQVMNILKDRLLKETYERCAIFNRPYLRKENENGKV